MTQVTCITKRQHQNPHERIHGIGGAGWWRAEDDAVRDVERDSRSYYASVGGKAVWVIVATHNGRKYLKTETDGVRAEQSVAAGGLLVTIERRG